MAISTALTSADVLRIRDEVLAEASKRGETLTPAQVVQGTRTMVHAAVMQENPVPYPLPAPDTGKTRADFLARMVKAGNNPAEHRRIHDEEVAHLAERKARMHLSVPPEAHVAFQQADEKDKRGIRDAHHFAQKEHGKAVWETADRLVAQALETN